MNYRGGTASDKAICITLYSNGFTVADEAFRKYEDPVNKAFMDQLKKGKIPDELRKKYKDNNEVAISNRLYYFI